MVGGTPTLSCPLHTHVFILAQPSGKVVRNDYTEGDPAGGVQKRQAPRAQNQRMGGAPQPNSFAIHLDSYGRFHL
jgi:hypothetical protein